MKPLTFSILPGFFTVHRLPPGANLPTGLHGSPFYSISASAEELSLVAPQNVPVASEKSEPGWVCLKVHGPLDFGEIGILAHISTRLAAAGISIFAVSTFDTDYILLKKEHLETAQKTLSSEHRFVETQPK